MFLKALQSYYGPTVTLFIFAAFIINDRLFSVQIKKLFLIESVLIFAIICATWIDGCLSTLPAGNHVWKLRTGTSFLNFFLSPCSPAILISIYQTHQWKTRLRSFLFYLPLTCNMILCIISIKYGIIFHITPENTYERGSLFIVPFAVSFFYAVSLVSLSWKQEKQNKKKETGLLAVIMIVAAGATLLEVSAGMYFMIWSTSEICVILYFLELTIQMLVFEPLTGAYSRIYYVRTLEKINRRAQYVLAMIDINNLKRINDTYGHCAGDEAICTTANALLKNADKRMRLYRIGGDEFVLMMKGSEHQALKNTLHRALLECNSHRPFPVSFAFGTVGYTPDQDLMKFLDKADSRMYLCKKQMKSKV
jgi:diguanylate cyclase (GGDEF)-like protein